MCFIDTMIKAKDIITEISGGGNLVEGQHPWELAEENKHDLGYMVECCNSELLMMKKTGLPAAPYYFERVAVLLRKAKDYRQEIHFCETYINLIEKLYTDKDTRHISDVRLGPRYQAIVSRVIKAKQLLNM